MSDARDRPRERMSIWVVARAVPKHLDRWLKALPDRLAMLLIRRPAPCGAPVEGPSGG
jgi:hypothetical protein